MTKTTDAIIDQAACGGTISDDRALALAACDDLERLQAAARVRKRRIHGGRVSYSPKVFIPLTKLCRDVCRYCTFAHAPRDVAAPYLSVDEAVAIAAEGARAGCHEVLFTLGDRPESRYRVAREALAALGYASTIEYLACVAEQVHAASGLLPHVNPGVMSRAELELLRPVSVSAGMMLESVSDRLCERGGPHFGCPDKTPRVRLESIRAAGELAVPFTSGILIGIGETRRERIESMLALRSLNDRYGHLQEIIVQNFCAKAGTVMAEAPEPTLDDHLWTIAVARLVFAPETSIQAPPNLSPGALEALLAAGIDDWGGVSPVTPDHVNPEAPWPQLEKLRSVTEAAGGELVARLPVYPRFVRDAARWLAPRMRASVLARSDAEGLAREDGWVAGAATTSISARSEAHCAVPLDAELGAIVTRARDGRQLREDEIVRLFSARGREVQAICRNADELRGEVNGERVTYVVNRNVNYTNVCYFRCRFCAFSKGKNSSDLRGVPYDLDLAEIRR
jgi:FO synthase